MKEEIERVLQSLVGEPLSYMMRFVHIQVFQFGVQWPGKNRKGQDITLADRGLHVSCFWSITGPEGTFLSRDDFDVDGGRRDEKAHPFYEMLQSNSPFVLAVEADAEGALHLQMSQGYTLDIEPDEQEEEPDEEQWRFLPKDENAPHLVFTLQGIER